MESSKKTIDVELRFHILEYLKNENALYSPINIILPFEDILNTLEERKLFANVLNYLKRENFITLNQFSRPLDLVTYNGHNSMFLYGLNELDIKASIKPLGESYLKEINQSKINSKSRPVKNSQPVCALLHYYLRKTDEGISINGLNQEAIATSYGFTSPNSGLALKNLYAIFTVNINRTGITEKKRTDNQMNNNFKKVIDILKQRKSTKALKLAEDEFLIFSNKYNSHYIRRYKSNV